MKVKIGFDLSLRGAGISVVDSKKNLKEIHIHQPKKKKDEEYEDLLIENLKYFEQTLKAIIKKYDVTQVNLEGLSYNSTSASSDVIGAQWWMLKILITRKLKLKCKVFMPSQWRKENQIKDSKRKLKEYKEELGKDYWKLMALGKLDQKIHDQIIYFCEEHKLKTKSEFDIAESYWIGCCE